MQQPASRIHPSNKYYIMICPSFILFLHGHTAYLARVFYVFKAMHLVYVLLYFFLAAPVSTKCRYLGGWEISSFGRLRGTHRRF